nr:unnamed protein product [Callosobruchus analis]
MVVKVALPKDRYIVTDMTGSHRVERRSNYERTVAVDRMKPWGSPGGVSDDTGSESDNHPRRPRKTLRYVFNEAHFFSISSHSIKFEELKKIVTQENFPNLFKAIRLAASTPNSLASCEKSFSAMRRIKIWLRTSLLHEGFSNLSKRKF